MRPRQLTINLGAFGLLIHAAAGQTYFPAPPTPAGNPTTPDKALLGKALFWDEQLSSSRTMACGTCHVFSHAGTDPRSASVTHPGPDGSYGTADDIHGSPGVVRQDAAGHYVGATGFVVHAQSTDRQAPPVINAAYENLLFWDGRAGGEFRDPVTNAVLLPSGGALENQAAGPPVSDVEMSHIGRSWSEIALDIADRQPLALAEAIPANLQAFVLNQTYANLFTLVYGSPGVTPSRIIFAIAAYERTLISDQSRFDRFLAGTGTLTVAELDGMRVFQNQCFACHLDIDAPSLVVGPGLNDFQRVGVRPEVEDLGRARVTALVADRARFKTPGLRNVALRAPHMHNGGLATLGDVVDFYNRGGDFFPNDPRVSAIAGVIRAAERTNVIAFLNTLTDPRVAAETAPFDRPRLYTESARVPVVFGTGTAGAGGFRPRMVSIAPPFVGNVRFAIGLERAAPAAPHFLALDIAGSTTPTVMFGQNVYVTPAAALTFLGSTSPASGGGPGDGYSHHVLPIPPAQLLIGMAVYGQWLVFDAAGPSGLTCSDAFSVTLF